LIRTGIDLHGHDVIISHLRVMTGAMGKPHFSDWEPDAFSLWLRIMWWWNIAPSCGPSTKICRPAARDLTAKRFRNARKYQP
jgi:hypothetical protein